MYLKSNHEHYYPFVEDHAFLYKSNNKTNNVSNAKFKNLSRNESRYLNKDKLFLIINVK